MQAKFLTFYALVHLSIELIDRYNFKFVLLGHLQTDDLERTFSWYRQKTGGKYLVSSNDILNTERKIKAYFLLKHTKADLKSFKIDVDQDRYIDLDFIKFQEDNHELVKQALDKDVTFEELCALQKVAGYSAYTILKKRSCSSCQSILTTSMTEENVLKNFFD